MAPQPFDMLKSPVTATLEMVTGAEPVLVKYTKFGVALVVPTTVAGKFRAVAVGVNIASLLTTPLPNRATGYCP